ncbi:LysE family translocator [Marinimicrococcus flavescens]|uniref:LysE family translocator n=1 Tax=Marinimicrococcus flavescens TaxID=3031815 RepID=A0AAP3XQ77_9PROT|nr:LysE family translocator [Marinimicrococcus flavescens]
MTMTQSLVAFVLAAGLLTVTPGLDTAMVLRTSTVEGPRRAALAAIGINIGCLVWGAAVALGLGALLAASETGYALLKWAGACYLFWLGIALVRRPRSGLANEAARPGRPGWTSGRAWLVRGLLTNLLNPKVGVFYVTFLPQFVPAGAPVAAYTFALAAVHVLLGLLWCALLIGASAPLGRALARPALLRAMDRLTGSLFIAFGVRLALSRQ